MSAEGGDVPLRNVKAIACYLYRGLVKSDSSGSSSNNNIDSETRKMQVIHMLYFAQGHYLAMVSRPLFYDDIIASNDGPSIVRILEEWDSIVIAYDLLSTNLQAYLNEVIAFYSQFTPSHLAALSRATPPWIAAREERVLTTEESGESIIEQDALRLFFEQWEASLLNCLPLLELDVTERMVVNDVWKKAGIPRVGAKFLEGRLSLSSEQKEEFLTSVEGNALQYLHLLAETVAMLEEMNACTREE